MSLFDTYFILHILFMVGIIILCTAVGMPTRYWMILGTKIRARFLHSRGEKLKKALQSQGVTFSSDESFLDRGVGLAIDHQRGLIFLAQPKGKQYQTTILPKARLGAHATLINQIDGFHRCFLKISETGTNSQTWLLPCADSELADEINDRLEQFALSTAS